MNAGVISLTRTVRVDLWHWCYRPIKFGQRPIPPISTKVKDHTVSIYTALTNQNHSYRVKLKAADDVFNLESGGMWIYVILN